MEKLVFDTKPMLPDELIAKLSSKTDELYAYFGNDIYVNTNKDYLDKQIDRLIKTVEFHKKNVGDRPTYLLRAPGRLNAFLEYLDMCAGDHMSTTIDGDIPVAISLRDDDLLRVKNVNDIFPNESVSIKDTFKLLKEKSWDKYEKTLPDNWDNRTKMYPFTGRDKGKWTNYLLAPYLRMLWDKPTLDIKGVDMSFGPASAPFRAGTSSSSALVVLAFLSMYIANQDKLGQVNVDAACKFLGEAEWYVGTHGGANDQTTILRNKANYVLYNRHSCDSLTSTQLPFIKGVNVVLANSLWEVNKSLGGNQSFNMRKGWMEIGDEIMKKNLEAIREAIEKGAITEKDWIAKLLKEKYGYEHIGHLPILEREMKLWENIFKGYKKFGSLDPTILNVPNEAVDELIRTLPVKINVQEASKVLGVEPIVIEQKYTKPKRKIGGYHVRTTARFFHKENNIGRELERVFLEANDRLEKGEITVDSEEYDNYKIKVGELVEHLQHILCYDFRVSNAQIDKLINIARKGPGYLAGKLTGAGKGGCVSLLVREESAKDMCDYLDKRYYNNPAVFEEYELILEDALKYFEDDDYEKMSALERLNNLKKALSNIEDQRRIITFSCGACVIDV